MAMFCNKTQSVVILRWKPIPIPPTPPPSDDVLL